MASAGVNSLRTYGVIEDVSVLDVLWSHGIYVIMTVYYDAGYGETPAGAVEKDSMYPPTPQRLT